ncbi:hypothetical protein NVP1161O_185 [Vibrio phage 1.161.O._10N.261.48.C5]|nr:hypothetical protein NVP1161O_185 [Vibrio phage 1.161.O._10N.261.48.C5]
MVVESKREDKVQSFVGTTFTTAKGGIFTVTSLLPREYYPSGVLKNAKFEGVCSICSTDKELFPEPFQFTKSSVLCGYKITIPCNCDSNLHWSSDQYKIRILRRFEALGFTVGSWWDTEKPNRQTRLEYSCNRCGNSVSNTISSALDTKDPCKACSSVNTGKATARPESTLTKRFTDKGYDVSIIRIDGKTFIDCNKCRVSEYTNLGGCRHIFPISYRSLQIVQPSCRCNSEQNFRWDIHEREFQIKSILSEEGGEFLGWKSGYQKYSSKFTWNCSRGHFCETSVDKFVNRGNRCRVCADIERDVSWSYNPEKKGDIDYMYVVKLKNNYEDFIKVGRTCNPTRRFGEYKPNFTLEIIGVYEDTYETVWHLERDFHATHKTLNYPSKTKYYGRSESYSYGILDFTKFNLKEMTYEFQ